MSEKQEKAVIADHLAHGAAEASRSQVYTVTGGAEMGWEIGDTLGDGVRWAVGFPGELAAKGVGAVFGDTAGNVASYVFNPIGNIADGTVTVIGGGLGAVGGAVASPFVASYNFVSGVISGPEEEHAVAAALEAERKGAYENVAPNNTGAQSGKTMARGA